MLGLKPLTLIKIVPIMQSNHACDVINFPNDGITALELFCYWLNIMEPPSRYFMEILSNYVSDELFKEKLKEFSSKTV